MADPGKIKEYIKLLKELEEIQKIINADLGNWVNSFELISDAQKQINDMERELVGLTGDEADALREELEIHRRKLSMMKDEHSLLKATFNSSKKITQEFAAQNFSLKQSFDWLVQIDKSLRVAAQAMGKVAKPGDALTSSLLDAAGYAAKLGMEVKDVAKFQSDYSEATGRNIELSARNLKNMVAMSKATGLGVDFVKEWASGWEIFGVNVDKTSKVLEETMNNTEKLGLNSLNIIKKMSGALKKAEGFVFRGGLTKGLEKMATLSEQFKVNMDEVFSLADKLRTVEGSIETAARLQVLGGEFAKMADPFKLMFEARNDIVGLTESLIRASKGVAMFNEKTGTFEIRAQELHRLKEVADATGLSMEHLQTMALQVGKLDLFKKKIGFKMNKEDMDLVANMARVSADGKSFEVKFTKDGKEVVKKLSDLGRGDLQYLRSTSKSLDERAKAALAFDQTWQAFIEEVKVGLLPLLKMVTKLTEHLKGMSNWLFGEEGELKLARTVLVSLGVLAGSGVLGLLFKLSKGVMSGLGGASKSLTPAAATSLAGATTGKGGLFSGLAGINWTNVLKGSGAMLVMSGSLFVFAKALQELKDVGWDEVLLAAGSLTILTGAMYALGAAMKAGWKVIGLGILGLVLIAGSLFVVAGGLKAMGGGLEGLAKGFGAFSNVNFMDVVTGLTALTGVMLGAGVTGIAGAVGAGLTGITSKFIGKAMQEMASNLEAITNIDTDKLDKLKMLYEMAAKAKPLSVKWEENLKVDFGKLVVDVEGDQRNIEGVLTDEWFRGMFKRMMDNSSGKGPSDNLKVP